MLAPMRSPVLTAATRPCARLRPHARTFAYGPKTEGTEALRKLRLMTAIKTPYNADGTIDLGAFDAHAEDQIQNGVEGFIIGGTTGEGHLFRWDEHIMLIAHTKHKFGDRCTVVGNTGSNNTGEAVNASEQGFAVGMDAALHINPYYGKTSEAGIVSHLNRSMEFGPTIVYNVPGRTGQDIPVETMMSVAGHQHFAGVKECMGRERIQAYSDLGVTTWSGNDDECHETRHEAGCQGVISVTSNLVPALFSQMMKEPSPEVAAQCEDLINWLFEEPNPIGVNTMMMMLGMCQPVFRLPYLQLDPEARKRGKAIIEAVGLEHVPGNNGCQILTEDAYIHTYCP